MLDVTEDFYRKSGAAQWGLSLDRFGEILEAIARRHIPWANEDEKKCFFCTLRMEELALAWGCASGDAAAWERFAQLYRPKLHSMALRLTREESMAREIAGSLLGDLFAGRLQSTCRRPSRFENYSGRGSLEGWLRTLVAQEHADRLRRERKLVSFEGELEGGVQFACPPATAETPDPRLTTALKEALSALKSEDRFLLASYYLDHRTLAEIAQFLHVHESTVSRRLERAKREVRSATRKALVARGVGKRQAEDMLAQDLVDAEFDLRLHLAGAAE